MPIDTLLASVSEKKSSTANLITSPSTTVTKKKSHHSQSSHGMTTNWLNCCKQKQPYQSVSMIQIHSHQNGNSSNANGINHSPSTSSSSSPSASNNNNNNTHHPICCGLSLIAVIRLTFLFALITCIIISVFFFAEVKGAFQDSLVYIKELGPLRGSVVLCLANIVGALLFMPCVPFTLGAGYLYGTFMGSIIVSVASTIAAVIAFLTARYLARVWIERSLGGKGSKFRILDNAINQDGFRIVLLIRSSPLHPYGVCNYLFGLTSVTGRDYTVASFFGMLPATIMEVYLGTAVGTVEDIINGNLDNSFESRVFFWVGLGVSMVVTVAITIILKRKLKTEMDKYRVVSTTEHEIDDEDEFGILDGGAGDADEVTTSVHVADTDTIDPEFVSSDDSHSDVSLKIMSHSPVMKPSTQLGLGLKTKNKPLTEPRKMVVTDSTGTSANTGLKHTTRRPASKSTSILKPGSSSLTKPPVAPLLPPPSSTTPPIITKMSSSPSSSTPPSSSSTVKLTPPKPHRSSSNAAPAASPAHSESLNLASPTLHQSSHSSISPPSATILHDEEEILESDQLL